MTRDKFRDKLLYNICPAGTIFDCRTGNKNYDCDDCNRVLEEWLDEYDKQIRADAIDDFAKKLKSKCTKRYIDCDPYFGGIEDSILYEDDIDETSEELKEQNK